MVDVYIVGSRCLVATSAIRGGKAGHESRKTAPAHSFTAALIMSSTSSGPCAIKGRTCSPNVGAAFCTSLHSRSITALRPHRITAIRDSRDAGKRFLEQLKLLLGKVRCRVGQANNVPTGPRQA